MFPLYELTGFYMLRTLVVKRVIEGFGWWQKVINGYRVGVSVESSRIGFARV